MKKLIILLIILFCGSTLAQYNPLKPPPFRLLISDTVWAKKFYKMSNYVRSSSGVGEYWRNGDTLFFNFNGFVQKILLGSTPDSGDIWKYNGQVWLPLPDAGGGGTSDTSLFTWWAESSSVSLISLEALHALLADTALYAWKADTANVAIIGLLTGPAGGDLTNTYPDPSIGAGKVTSTMILNYTVGTVDLSSTAKAPFSGVSDSTLKVKLGIIITEHFNAWAKSPYSRRADTATYSINVPATSESLHVPYYNFAAANDSFLAIDKTWIEGQASTPKNGYFAMYDGSGDLIGSDYTPEILSDSLRVAGPSGEELVSRLPIRGTGTSVTNANVTVDEHYVITSISNGTGGSGGGSWGIEQFAAGKKFDTLVIIGLHSYDIFIVQAIKSRGVQIVPDSDGIGVFMATADTAILSRGCLACASAMNYNYTYGTGTAPPATLEPEEHDSLIFWYETTFLSGLYNNNDTVSTWLDHSASKDTLFGYTGDAWASANKHIPHFETNIFNTQGGVRFRLADTTWLQRLSAVSTTKLAGITDQPFTVFLVVKRPYDTCASYEDYFSFQSSVSQNPYHRLEMNYSDRFTNKRRSNDGGTRQMWTEFSESNSPDYTAPHVLTFMFDGATSDSARFWVDGVSYGAVFSDSMVSALTINKLTLGASIPSTGATWSSRAYPSNVWVGAFVGYNRALPEAERLALETYLKGKYVP